MKYLKEYKLFESLDDHDVSIFGSYILADLQDDGFKVSSRMFKLNGRSYFSLSIRHDDTKFYSDIKPVIDHLVSFLKENDYKLNTVQNIIDEVDVYFSIYADPSQELGRVELLFDKFI